MQGQANHFVRYAGEDLPYAKARYQDELRRLYSVLDKHLADIGSSYLVGEKCTIADICHWGWVTLSRWAGVELSNFPALTKWEERMFERPGVQEGRQVPDGGHQRELLRDPERMAAFEERGRKFYRDQAEQGMKTKQGV
jgi:glutathione S-transferase